MARGRKNGCPVSVADWDISIQDKSQLTETWIRISGLNSITRSTEGETEDGSADSDIWSEPYITKRSGNLELEGVKKILEDTGEIDQGQEMLDDYAEQAGCEGDATLRLVDPYGHAMIIDAIVTKAEETANGTTMTRSWTLQQVGEAEVLRYVNVASVRALRDGQEAAAVSMSVSDAPVMLRIEILPQDASNRRFKVSNNRRGVVRVTDTSREGFCLTPVAVGTATVTVKTVNGGESFQIAVTVTE